ncbi:HyaD/HybD family hydrogenase maturation endopeptidase [Rodentibacter trehalosifermentans]|uniref:Hydrogenase expression/formation protein n=1 Tax=Rodentibacter trehalosifermentans TaxID=1908263 RepID=A0A1V3IS71_9PAST|nr:HyaD/HybD family hydrogenase maturation endopeptidase [Rodentibacter trehalosifermentans]OOF45115.1 hydrogenase expression/formation protein [Rodentibacter trehalosifermentans]OOF47222.1 hydrogenase expression/formation protein [Rodentibacter trehalosifermentans]
MKPLILGVGNILLGDEGIGVRVAQALENHPEIQPHFDVIDGGTCGMELLDEMASRDHIIIVDAVLANKQPGEMVILYDDQVPVFFSQKISPHQLGICDVLSALKLTGEFPKNLCLVGIQPETLEPQIALSEKIKAMFPTIFETLETVLKKYGFQTSLCENVSYKQSAV